MSSVVYVLLVTWFTAMGGSSYQLEFDSRESCEQAVEALRGEEVRLGRLVSAMMDANEADQSPEMAALSQMMAPMMKMMQGSVQPFVSAVCVQR